MKPIDTKEMERPSANLYRELSIDTSTNQSVCLESMSELLAWFSLSRKPYSQHFDEYEEEDLTEDSDHHIWKKHASKFDRF